MFDGKNSTSKISCYCPFKHPRKFRNKHYVFIWFTGKYYWKKNGKKLVKKTIVLGVFFDLHKDIFFVKTLRICKSLQYLQLLCFSLYYCPSNKQKEFFKPLGTVQVLYKAEVDLFSFIARTNGVLCTLQFLPFHIFARQENLGPNCGSAKSVVSAWPSKKSPKHAFVSAVMLS